jgi:putative addiction module component (TIGR02574 family)
MNSSLVDTAKRLPVAERIELIETLWESITAEGYEPPLTAEQATELDQRLDAHQRNPEEVISWESIKEDLLKRRSWKPMSLPVVFRPIARQEMDDAIAWYESKLSSVGIEFVSQIASVVARIADAPTQFRNVRGDVRRAVLHRFPYTIHFLHESDRIVVLAVFHVKRNPKRLEDR